MQGLRLPVIVLMHACTWPQVQGRGVACRGLVLSAHASPCRSGGSIRLWEVDAWLALKLNHAAWASGSQWKSCAPWEGQAICPDPCHHLAHCCTLRHLTCHACHLWRLMRQRLLLS